MSRWGGAGWYEAVATVMELKHILGFKWAVLGDWHERSQEYWERGTCFSEKVINST